MKYEYLHLQFQTHNLENISSAFDNDFEKCLNYYGNLGWALLYAFDIHGGYHFILSRSSDHPDFVEQSITPNPEFLHLLK